MRWFYQIGTTGTTSLFYCIIHLVIALVIVLGGMVGERPRNGCFNCGKEGHMSRECPEGGRGGRGGRGGGRGRRGARSTGINMGGTYFV